MRRTFHAICPMAWAFAAVSLMFIKKLCGDAMRTLFILLLIATTAFGQCKPYDNFFDDSERGWFYSELCEVEDNKTDNFTILPTKVTIPWEMLDQIDPDDTQKIEGQSRKIAMMYPDDYNMIEYKRIISWMTKKSDAYSRADTRIKTLYPDTVDFALNVPTNLWAKDQQMMNNSKLQDETLNKYTDKVGLIVFATETCPYCKEQTAIMDMLKNDYGYEYTYLYISEAPNTAAEFKVQTVPDIFMVADLDGEAVWQRISTGLTSYTDLKQALLLGLGGIYESTIY
jgi:thiol-disulfide isomerase/thioredoxin